MTIAETFLKVSASEANMSDDGHVALAHRSEDHALPSAWRTSDANTSSRVAFSFLFITS